MEACKMEAQLKTDIKNNTYKNIYILSGEEKYMMDYYCNAIVNANTDPDSKDFNYLKIMNTLNKISYLFNGYI